MSMPRSGFPTVDDETQRVTYEEGTLRLDLKLPGRATWTMREFGDWPLADVEGTFAPIDEAGTGFYGLTCGVDTNDYYAGVIASDGTALLLRVDDGVATGLAQQFSAVTPPSVGASLRLELACVGVDAGGTTGVTLSSAGRVLAAAVDPSGFLSLRRAGFYAESAPDSERFSIRADDFVVTVGLLAGPVGEASPSPSLTGDPDADALAERVPEHLRSACRKVVLSAFDAAVAIDCASPATPMAFYLQYASETVMVEDYQELLAAHPESTGSDCAVGPGEGPYTVDGLEVGRLLCFASYGASFVWVDGRIDVMGYARRADGSFAELYDWWLEAGPTP